MDDILEEPKILEYVLQKDEFVVVNGNVEQETPEVIPRYNLRSSTKKQKTEIRFPKTKIRFPNKVSVEPVDSYDVYPVVRSGFSFQPFPIIGYPQEFVMDLPNDGSTSADAHPLLRNEYPGCPWRELGGKCKERYKNRKYCEVCERWIGSSHARLHAQSLAHKRKEVLILRKKNGNLREVGPIVQLDKKNFCHICGVWVNMVHFARHRNMRGHIDKELKIGSSTYMQPSADLGGVSTSEPVFSQPFQSVQAKYWPPLPSLSHEAFPLLPPDLNNFGLGASMASSLNSSDPHAETYRKYPKLTKNQRRTARRRKRRELMSKQVGHAIKLIFQKKKELKKAERRALSSKKQKEPKQDKQDSKPPVARVKQEYVKDDVKNE